MLFDRQGNLWMGSYTSRKLVKWFHGMLPTCVGTSPSSSFPRSCCLSQNHPNPFNAGTRIGFSVPGATGASTGCDVRLGVHALTGALVRSLVAQRLTPGWHSVAWDGRDDQGNPVASGVYVYRLRAGDRWEARRAALVR